MDIKQRHPAYDAFSDAWRLMRDAIGGEDVIKSRGTAYLPLKTAQAAMEDESQRQASYAAYMMRAEFPEIVAPTVTGHLGLIHSQPLTFELPARMEPLLDRATADGLTLEDFAEKVTSELLSVGRYGILPTFSEEDGAPLLAGYTTETIINWDAPGMRGLEFVVLDESRSERNPVTNVWRPIERYRELAIEDGRLVSRIWQDGSATEEPVAYGRTDRAALDFNPFVALGTRTVTIEPEDVPLYGLARIAVRLYRLDADYMQGLHMTSEPTPYITGYDDVPDAIRKGNVPTAVGASKLWLLPRGATAGFLEFTGPGLAAQRAAIDASREAAATFGARMFDETNRAPESGESRKTRYSHNTSALKTIAKVTAAGLERALRNQARWMGLDPETVSVTPNLDWVTDTMSATELAALVKAWQDGVISYDTLFEQMQAGKIIAAGKAIEEEVDQIVNDKLRDAIEPDIESPEAGMVPAPAPGSVAGQQQPIES